MPELPEVETVVKGLQKNLPGRRIKQVQVFKEKQLVNITGEFFLKETKGEIFKKITRLGKYIIFHFNSRKKMVAHLRMTGKFIFINNPGADGDGRIDGAEKAEEKKGPKVPEKHIRIRFYLEDGSLLLFQDMRIFGTIAFYMPGEQIGEKEKVGLDPFDPLFSKNWLYEQAKKRKIPIKNFLLDQKALAGLGNIYVCEALFKARISPLIRAADLNPAQAEALARSILEILFLAIKKNGTSVSDYRTVEDKTGEFQNMLKVYQKEGTICPGCKKSPILRIKQAQRSTFYCPVCQVFPENPESIK